MTEYRPRTRTVEATQVTADNAADIAASVNGTVNADGSISFEVYGDPVTARATDYVFTAPMPGVWPAEDFERDYEEVPDGPTNRERLAAIEARLTAIDGVTT